MLPLRRNHVVNWTGHLPIVPMLGLCLTERRISGGRTYELASADNYPLHPLDGLREAPDRKRVAIRNADGAARSVRAIY